MLNFIKRIIGTKSPIFIWLVTLFQGKSVGEDYIGNRYFTGRPRKNYRYERRWVMYAHGTDSSQVPPEWHAWLHHQSDDIPNEQDLSTRRKWQKPHKPNLTGTSKAWQRPRYDETEVSHYKAWSPDD